MLHHRAVPTVALGWAEWNQECWQRHHSGKTETQFTQWRSESGSLSTWSSQLVGLISGELQTTSEAFQGAQILCTQADFFPSRAIFLSNSLKHPWNAKVIVQHSAENQKASKTLQIERKEQDCGYTSIDTIGG